MVGVDNPRVGLRGKISTLLPQTMCNWIANLSRSIDGIYTYIYHKSQPNAGPHGWYEVQWVSSTQKTRL